MASSHQSYSRIPAFSLIRNETLSCDSVHWPRGASRCIRGLRFCTCKRHGFGLGQCRWLLLNAICRRRYFGCNGSHWRFQVSILLIEIGFHNIAHNRCGNFTTMEYGALYQDGNYNLWIPARREAHEPRIILVVAAVFDFRKALRADHLSAAGLAAQLHAFNVGDVGSPARESWVHHVFHVMRNFINSVLRDGKPEFTRGLI